MIRIIDFLIICSLLIGETEVQAQADSLSGGKPALTAADLGNWPGIANPKITPDGKYALYSIEHWFHNERQSSELVVQATDNSWKTEMPGVKSYFTANDSKKAIFLTNGDSLGVIDLGNRSIQYTPYIDQLRPLGDNELVEWIVFVQKNEKNAINLLNLKTGEKRVLGNSKYCSADETGSVLILLSSDTLQWYDIKSNNTFPIRNGEAERYAFNNAHTKVYFLVNDHSTGDNYKSLWGYDHSQEKTSVLINGDTLLNNSGYILKSIEPRDYKNDQLFISIEEKRAPHRSEYKDQDPTIWNYSDKALPTLAGRRNISNHTAVFDVSSKKFVFIERNDEFILGNSQTHLLVQQDSADHDSDEWYWNASKKKFFIVPLATGQRQLIFESDAQYPASMSPDGKFVLLYDIKLNKLISYEINTSVKNTLLWPDAVSNIYDTAKQTRHRGSLTPPVLGWMPDANAILLREKYDIWRVDLNGKKKPVNITNGYGSRHHISFHPLFTKDFNLSDGQSVILSAFNRDTKENGFYEMVIGSKIQDPVKRTIGAFDYKVMDAYPSVPYDVAGETPVKAADSSCFIVRRMDASTAPNYFFTKDFEHFTQLSFINPERTVNWLTTELVKWKLSDGTSSQGILYKPENFNPAKKYPLIIYYYEELSDQLNVFIKPVPSHGPMSIPWFVSNGYLVFVPDIHYKAGHVGESACNTVVSAAQYLSGRNYVDKNRIGIQGHSFGGYETNYIVTHSHLFAAACSAAADCDLAGHFGTLWGSSGASTIAIVEEGQYIMRSLPWTARALYIKNSPVYFINNITTPVLLMHNRKDANVDFRQGLEFFLSLRRAGKKAWLLEYKKDDHILDYPSAMDYNTRMTQFFDHFLKGRLMPDWMKTGN